MSGVYELQAPTSWATPPELWSSSSLDQVEACPRQWQLLRSAWGDHERFPERPRPAAIEGQIVHDALDRLARACGQRGNPAFGEPEFKDAMDEADFLNGFAKHIASWHERLAHHPRPGPPFRLRTTPDVLRNRAVRLFRGQYRPGTGGGRAAAPVGSGRGDLAGLLRARGALSEVRLRHPALPFFGIVDRLQRTGEGTEVVDFKSGQAKAAHRTQLERYALLWWRCTGDMPTRVTAQYLQRRESWRVDEATLRAIEDSIEAAIASLSNTLSAPPATTRPGAGCSQCAVRARCDEGWTRAEESARSEGRGDAELTLMGQPGPHGFECRDQTGRDVAVVHQPAMASLLPDIGVGQVVRVVDGVWKEKHTELEIRAWTEVFIMDRTATHGSASRRRRLGRG